MTKCVEIDLQELRQYETFKSQSEMDSTIYKHIEFLRSQDAADSVIEVLLYLGRSSLRVLGVSFPFVETIAEGIGMSKSTVQRAIKTLKQYGIIETIPTIKRWGYNAAKWVRGRKKSGNLYIINSSMTYEVDTAEEAAEVNGDNGLEDEISNEPFATSNLNNLKDLDTIDDVNEFDVEALPPSFDREVCSLIKSYFGMRKVYGLWKTVQNAMKHVIVTEFTAEVRQLTISALKQTALRYKTGKINSFGGYFYTTLVEMFHVMKRKQIVSAGTLYCNWLES